MAIGKYFSTFSALVGILAMFAMPANADMGVFPLRQVLTLEDPSSVFTISNPSDRIIEGRVTWIDLSATETGYAQASPESRAKLSAAPYLVVTPAQFRLKPGARMDISVQIRDGVKLPKGERRSHLLVETEASRTPIRKASNRGLQVDVGLGVSVPVILRNGGKTKSKFDDTRLLRDTDGTLNLETMIVPSGNNSSYGRVIVEYTPEQHNSSAVQLGVRENVAVFTDTEKRKVSVPFGFVSLDAGEILIRYEGQEEYEGVVFDERVFDLAPPVEED
ncbi:hypothetical protein PUV54_01105 [Hyphococcus flavus]|uniref:Molecular chaperone n=1 Tax=Hyphococcus flavus TaxID=1866326 RepID=A0AAF0CG46_9PROT|nr:hypothetical protein [Hyphococcus flavus]WDI31783.1 hypothetical protein PUV54_01105 [Hyphococcus flavus]